MTTIMVCGQSFEVVSVRGNILTLEGFGKVRVLTSHHDPDIHDLHHDAMMSWEPRKLKDTCAHKSYHQFTSKSPWCRDKKRGRR